MLNELRSNSTDIDRGNIINCNRVVDNEPNSLPELLSPEEARKYLTCSKDTIYALMRKRDFPSFKIGARFYVDKEDFIEWMKRGQRKGK